MWTVINRRRRGIAPALALLSLSVAVPAALSAQPRESYSSDPPVSLIDSLAKRCLMAPSGVLAKQGFEVKIYQTKGDAAAVNGYGGRGYPLTAAERANGVQYRNRYSVWYLQRPPRGEWDQESSDFTVSIARGVMDFRGEQPNDCRYKVQITAKNLVIQVLEERPHPRATWTPTIIHPYVPPDQE